jgi:hypothetical protein
MKVLIAFILMSLSVSAFGDREPPANPEIARQLKGWLYTYETTSFEKMRSEAIRQQRMIIFNLESYHCYDVYLIEKVKQQAKKYKRICI